MDQITELLTRGVAECIVKEDLEKKLRSGKKLRIKLGADPSAPNIHIGNAVAIWALKRFQDLGHQIVFIVGDVTGMIGDTSDKEAMRKQLTKEEVEENMAPWREQVGKILDLSKIEFVYNSEWLGKMTFPEVCNLAKNFTVAQMIERDNYWKRFQEQKPIGLHEFMYPLMQGYDSVAVRADVEVGGRDQLFNILAGRVLQEAFGQEPQNVLVFDLLEGCDGRKMSTSYGNVINLADSPKEMFGKTMSIKDELIIRYFTLATTTPMERIQEIQQALEGGMNPRDAKIELAKTLVTMYHSKEAADHEEKEFLTIFSQKGLPSEMEHHDLEEPTPILLDVLINLNLVPSKGEGRRIIEQGGVEFAGEKITDPQSTIALSREKQVLKVGKRTFVTISLGMLP